MALTRQSLVHVGVLVVGAVSGRVVAGRLVFFRFAGLRPFSGLFCVAVECGGSGIVGAGVVYAGARSKVAC